MRAIKQLGMLAAVAAGLLQMSAHTGAYNVFGPRWSSSQVAYFVNPATPDAPPDAVIAAVRQAADAWGAQSDASFAFVYAGTTSGTSVGYNGRNEVFFRNESKGSAAATTYYWSSGGAILDADIIYWDAPYTFVTGSSGCSGDLFVEDVGTHEFGHAAGLAHSTVSAATMYPTISYCGTTMRSLNADDISGIESLYPPSATTSTPPSAPSGLAADVSAQDPIGTIELEWTDTASNEAGFSLERSGDGQSFAEVAQLGTNATSFGDTGLAGGTMYSYRVRAFNSQGYSSYSAVASAQTVLELSSPAAPSGPSPVNGAANVSGSVTLSWNASAGAQAYDVYFGTSANPPLHASNLSTNGIGIGQPAAGVTHYWKVVAKNSAGTASSPVWSFTTAATSTGSTKPGKGGGASGNKGPKK